MSTYRQHHKTVREPSPWALSSIFLALIVALVLSLSHYLDREDETEATVPQEVQVSK